MGLTVVEWSWLPSFRISKTPLWQQNNYSNSKEPDVSRANQTYRIRLSIYLWTYWKMEPLSPHYVSSKDQHTDLLTKALSQHQHHQLSWRSLHRSTLETITYSSHNGWKVTTVSSLTWLMNVAEIFHRNYEIVGKIMITMIGWILKSMSVRIFF